MVVLLFGYLSFFFMVLVQWFMREQCNPRRCCVVPSTSSPALVFFVKFASSSSSSLCVFVDLSCCFCAWLFFCLLVVVLFFIVCLTCSWCLCSVFFVETHLHRCCCCWLFLRSVFVFSCSPSISSLWINISVCITIATFNRRRHVLFLLLAWLACSPVVLFAILLRVCFSPLSNLSQSLCVRCCSNVSCAAASMMIDDAT